MNIQKKLGIVYGENFSISPSQGYFVKDVSSGNFTILGTVSRESYPSKTVNG